MLKKYLTRAFVVLSAALTLVACEGTKTDPRQAFVGDYNYVTTGDIDLYAGGVKIYTFPMDQEGEMSIALAEKENAVWVKVMGDSTIAYVSGKQLFMDPSYEEAVYNDLVMNVKFVFSKAELVENQLAFTADVEINATYRETINANGSGTVNIVATKK